MDWPDDYEDQTEYEEAWEAHLTAKRKRADRRRNGKYKAKRLCRRLRSPGTYRPSIWADYNWNADTNDYEYNGRVKRAKHSNQQKWMKKYSNHIIRRHAGYTVSQKGNYYRRQFDYWWTWI